MKQLLDESYIFSECPEIIKCFILLYKYFCITSEMDQAKSRKFLLE